MNKGLREERVDEHSAERRVSRAVRKTSRAQLSRVSSSAAGRPRRLQIKLSKTGRRGRRRHYWWQPA